MRGAVWTWQWTGQRATRGAPPLLAAAAVAYAAASLLLRCCCRLPVPPVHAASVKCHKPWPLRRLAAAAAAAAAHRPGEAEAALRCGLKRCLAASDGRAALQHELDRLLEVGGRVLVQFCVAAV